MQEAAMEVHDSLVCAISAKVKGFYEQQKPFRLYHGATNSTRRSHRHADSTVDTSRLSRVLGIDPVTKMALAEPNVPMDALVEATLAHGLVPFVVMEFPGITVGGGFSGTSGESSSFRHGPFEATIASIELVLADGSVARASPFGENKDLFWGAASALGTVGVVTLLEVRLRNACAYVRLEYALAGSAEEARGLLEEESAKEANHYLEAVVFSPTETVVCTGQLTDELPAGRTAMRFSGRSDPWFYMRVESVRRELLKMQKRSRKDHHGNGYQQRQQQQQQKDEGERRVVDYIPLREYLFRWDRGAFWAAKYALDYFYMPLNRITSYLLDSFTHTRDMFRGLHVGRLADFHVIQDVSVPPPRVAEFQRWLDAEMGIYPLWICPVAVARPVPDATHSLYSDLLKEWGGGSMLNFGIWGPVPGGRRGTVEKTMALERKVRELGGWKCLYAQTFYDEDDFWEVHNRVAYETVRRRCRAEYLPSVYDKVRVDVEAEERAKRASWGSWMEALVMSVWPLAGVRGFLGMVVGEDYLIKS